jgi:DNA (cytosine-5)-methyltransferase 1
LAGGRSGLWWEFHRILAGIRPRWCVVENVLGLLSSNGGRDFAAVVQGLAELGYGVAWRVFDAQWFGVAQRRRRVFVVGHLGAPWAASGQVLDLAQGCGGDSAPRRPAGQAVAGTLEARTRGGGFPGTDAATSGFLVSVSPPLVARDWKSTKPEASGAVVVPAASGVRRLTPVECARLQGFPDDWNDHLADTHRYRQYGNAVCVPVAEWLCRRLAATGEG